MTKCRGVTGNDRKALVNIIATLYFFCLKGIEENTTGQNHDSE